MKTLYVCAATFVLSAACASKPLTPAEVKKSDDLRWDKSVAIGAADTYIVQGGINLHFRYDGGGTIRCTTCAHQPCADAADHQPFSGDIAATTEYDATVPEGRWLVCAVEGGAPGKLDYRVRH